jgi:phosphoribosylformylglycinamidine synthase
VAREHHDDVIAVLRLHDLSAHSHGVGRTNGDRTIEVWHDGTRQFVAPLAELQQEWDSVSWRIARLRDNPACADAEHAAVGADDDPGLHLHLTFEPASQAPAVIGRRPRVAVLREQGVISHLEMARLLDLAGFEACDVHMTDLQNGRARLADVQALVACGGFSYGDTLGAGEVWARSILFNPQLADAFAAFFNRRDTLALGICNGCHMLAALSPLIPSTTAWPRFTRNHSQQFEARLSLVEVLDSPSLFLCGMAGSLIPIAVAHGEGHADDPAPAATQVGLSLNERTLQFP